MSSGLGTGSTRVLLAGVALYAALSALGINSVSGRGAVGAGGAGSKGERLVTGVRVLEDGDVRAESAKNGGGAVEVPLIEGEGEGSRFW